MRRLIIALLAACLVVVPARAATTLNGGSNAHITWGDVAAVENLSALSICLTVDITSLATAERLVGKYNAFGNDRQFLVLIDDTDEIGFLIAPDTATSSNWYGKVTTATNVSTGLHRICVKLDAAGDQGAAWVNGVSQAVTARGTSTNTSATTANTTTPLFVGRGGNDADGVDGDYSEVAIWAAYVPDWVFEAYGKGFSPHIYLANRVFYAPLHNTSQLLDRQGGVAGSNSSGSNAATHPAILYRP